MITDREVAAFNALVAAAEEFVRRVEAGEIRSKTTYRAMKEALALLPTVAKTSSQQLVLPFKKDV